jgi:hypothetical protein
MLKAPLWSPVTFTLRHSAFLICGLTPAIADVAIFAMLSIFGQMMPVLLVFI